MSEEMSRGDGRVFRRGSRWAIDYYAPGPDGKRRKVREKAGDTEKGARALLRERLRQVGNDRVGLQKFVPPSTAGILLSTLLDDVVKDYERRKLKSLRETKNHQRRVRAEFGKRPALTITSKVVEDYIAKRQAEGAAPATVDHETETIQRAFSLARQRGTMLFAPYIPKTLKKNANAREGFLEPADFRKILEHVPDADLVDALEWMWWTGMRHSEFCALTWDAWDGKVLRLASKDEKSGPGRVIPVVGPLTAIIERREARRHAKSPLVFHSKGATMRAKSGGFQFRLGGLWRAACVAAELTDAISYDLRRSAVRNLIGAGVPQKVAMLITGHRTIATFQRYLIVTTDDVADALEAVEAYVRTQATERKVLRFGRKGGANGSKDGSKPAPDPPKGL
jgi:integrase